MNPPPARALFGAIVVVAIGAVGVALLSQFGYDMQPCPWCVLQRAVFVAIAVAALPGLLLRSAPVRLGSAALVLALAAGGAAAALWQHLVAASNTSCAMTLADRIVRGLALDELWPAGFSATASCADAAVKVAGVPYEFFSLALFAAIAVAALGLLRRRG